jgi:hypothetical protein
LILKSGLMSAAARRNITLLSASTPGHVRFVFTLDSKRSGDYGSRGTAW